MKADYLPRLTRARSPLLISIPHAGTEVPPALAKRFSAESQHLPDTDWYVDRLYSWASSAGAGLLVAGASRFVIDVNRPPDDAPLYDFSGTGLRIGLVPATTFAGKPVYRPGCGPDAAEIEERLERYWNPYHRRLADELGRIRDRYGHAVLLDAHSIRSEVPLLFDGVLPDLNLGSNGGSSAASSLLTAVRGMLGDSPFSLVVDGRFRGGYITRHYGDPGSRIHALQLEMAQTAYMKEDPPQWRDVLARPMQDVLRGLVRKLIEWRPKQDET